MGRRFNGKYVRNVKQEAPVERTPDKVFAAVYGRYRQIHARDLPTGQNRMLRDREFIADFELTAKRILSPRQYAIFRAVHVWCMETASAAIQLRMDRIDVMLAKSRIEELIGKAARDTKPYPLFPLDEYFRTPARKESGWQNAANLPPRVPTAPLPAR